MYPINSTLTGTTRVLTTTNDKNNSTSFRTTYYPRPDDAGTFRVEAYHPGFEQSSGNTLTWVILGMRCEPNFVSLKSYIDGSQAVFTNVSTLKNIGGYPIINISSKVYGIENVHVFKSEDKTEEAFFMTDLNSDEMVSFGFQMKDVKPMLKTFYIVFSTTDRTYERLQINVDLSIKKPILFFEPNAVKDNIIRGTQNILDITIKNIGDIQARDVNIHIPNESKISLLSLSRKGETLNYANEQLRDSLTIPALSEAIMSLAVTVESNTPLGELRGTIAVNINLTTFILPYAITITSERRLNLTFEIKDEYTYFATGSPLVIGAEVKLVNPRRGYSETRLTYNDTGAVLFENIYEDKYNVYAKAEGHSTYSAIIIATPYTTVRDIFLQRTAVTYTWTVTPTTVEDKYKITLDSTFETFSNQACHLVELGWRPNDIPSRLNLPVTFRNVQNRLSKLMKKSPLSLLREAMTMELNQRLVDCATALQDKQLLAKLSRCDVISQEITRLVSQLYITERDQRRDKQRPIAVAHRRKL
ncbi:Hypothetical predicted protein [Mytilus galloprovincialis]|uniref:Uncharacterized protein n=1 Tax=Mytilus galloprovincialis TaxID=29158 RepID=A0A8B6DKM7_MYTGA|nr:Hypothetical predicted protein [Mytilus galloprovincialis]